MYTASQFRSDFLSGSFNPETVAEGYANFFSSRLSRANAMLETIVTAVSEDNYDVADEGLIATNDGELITLSALLASLSASKNTESLGSTISLSGVDVSNEVIISNLRDQCATMTAVQVAFAEVAKGSGLKGDYFVTLSANLGADTSSLPSSAIQVYNVLSTAPTVSQMVDLATSYAYPSAQVEVAPNGSSLELPSVSAGDYTGAPAYAAFIGSIDIDLTSLPSVIASAASAGLNAVCAVGKAVWNGVKSLFSWGVDQFNGVAAISYDSTKDTKRLDVPMIAVTTTSQPLTKMGSSSRLEVFGRYACGPITSPVTPNSEGTFGDFSTGIDDDTIIGKLRKPFFVKGSYFDFYSWPSDDQGNLSILCYLRPVSQSKDPNIYSDQTPAGVLAPAIAAQWQRASRYDLDVKSNVWKMNYADNAAYYLQGESELIQMQNALALNSAFVKLMSSTFLACMPDNKLEEILAVSSGDGFGSTLGTINMYCTGLMSPIQWLSSTGANRLDFSTFKGCSNFYGPSVLADGCVNDYLGWEPYLSTRYPMAISYIDENNSGDPNQFRYIQGNYVYDQMKRHIDITTNTGVMQMYVYGVPGVNEVTQEAAENLAITLAMRFALMAARSADAALKVTASESYMFPYSHDGAILPTDFAYHIATDAEQAQSFGRSLTNLALVIGAAAVGYVAFRTVSLAKKSLFSLNAQAYGAMSKLASLAPDSEEYQSQLQLAYSLSKKAARWNALASAVGISGGAFVNAPTSNEISINSNINEVIKLIK